MRQADPLCAPLLGMPARPAPGFKRQIHRLLVRADTARLAFENFQGLTPREPAHLLEPLDWDQRGKRLALALDESGLRDWPPVYKLRTDGVQI